MDFSAQLDQLQQRVEQARAAVQAAASESRERLRQRIDQAQADLDQAGTHAQ
jgi:outer membrane murein-binding lipoprotein Lpp